MRLPSPPDTSIDYPWYAELPMNTVIHLVGIKHSFFRGPTEMAWFLLQSYVFRTFNCVISQ